MRQLVDKLGRVKFTPYTQKPTKDFTPKRDQIAWMRFLNLHGPLSSHYLHALTPKNRDDFARELRALYNGQMVYKPVAQRLTEYPDGHFHVYDLAKKGLDYLKSETLWVDALRPTGKWTHQFMVASITASMDILCKREGYRYVPPHEYLRGADLGSYVPFSWNGETIRDIKLVPDAVFAIDYDNDSYIAYALEADRNTEPVASSFHDRKSDLRAIRQYQSFIGGKLYRTVYEREAKMVLLYVTVSKGHAQNVLDLVKHEIGPCSYIATVVEDAFSDPFYPPKVLAHLFDKGLLRANKAPFLVDPRAKGKAVQPRGLPAPGL